jgi:hypothetical protein
MQLLSKKLLDQVRDVLRAKHYFYHTEKTYCNWITRFIAAWLSKAHSTIDMILLHPFSFTFGKDWVQYSS